MKDMEQYLCKLARIKKPKEVCEKLSTIIRDGVDKLQVISDFDRTLSRGFLPSGEANLSTHALIETALLQTNAEAANMLTDLTKKYLPIEFCPKLTIEEKIPHMLQWWEEGHKIVAEAKLSKESLERLAETKCIMLRDRYQEFFELLESADVPLIIFSAGIGDVIEMLLNNHLERHQVPHNCHIISNFVEFDEQGLLVTFKHPLVHTFNKNSSVIPDEQPKFFERLRDRHNVILLGDTIGDTHMDLGLEEEKTILKIGYLNSDVDRLLSSYMDAYDIVLVEDSSLHVPILIFQKIVSVC